MSFYKELKNLLAQSIAETAGESAVTAIDGENLVDVGRTITSTWDSDLFDSCYKTFIDKCNKQIFHNDEFNADELSIMKEFSEYGGILEKSRVVAPDLEEVDRFDLNNYTPSVFDVNLPSVYTKYYNKYGKYDLKVTLQNAAGTNEPYLKTAFSSEANLNKFFGAIITAVKESFDIYKYQLSLLALDNAIAEVVKVNRQINLLSLYKLAFPSATTTSANYMTDKEFIRFATMIMRKYPKRLKSPSILYNNDGFMNISKNLSFYVSDDFMTAVDTYLLADTFNADKLKINDITTIAYWQGTGTSDDERLKIDIIPASEGEATTPDTRTEIVENNVIGVLFDERAIACTATALRIKKIENPQAEFINNFYHAETGWLNDLSENIVVFTVNDYAAVYLDTEPADWDKTDNVYYAVSAGTYTKVNDDFAEGWYFKKIA